MRFEIEQTTVTAAQAAMPRFRVVPTHNSTPIVHLVGDVLCVSHVDFSPDNICVYGQLPNQIHVFEGALVDAMDVAGNRDTHVKRKRVAAYATLLDTYVPPPAEPNWLNDEEDDDPFDILSELMSLNGHQLPHRLTELKKKSDEASVVLKLAMSGLPAHMFAPFMAYMKQRELGADQLTEEVLGQYRNWFNLSSELAVIDAMPGLLETVLNALKREATNRENARMVIDLREQMKQTTREHAQALRKAEVAGAVKVIQCLKLDVAEKREAAIRAAFPDLADDIISALDEPVTEAENGEAPDWLSEFTPEGDERQVEVDQVLTT